ncbi:S26 family signal peptidase [Actinokineospora sp. 24-640]
MTAWIAAALCVAALLWLRSRLVRVHVRGVSMLPNLSPGDRVLVRRTPLRHIRPGDVVVFGRPRATMEGWMVKRVLAVPGDPIPRQAVPLLWRYPGSHVPPARLVVLGDNPNESYDSRTFGYLNADLLLGVVTTNPPKRPQPLTAAPGDPNPTPTSTHTWPKQP